MCTPDDLQHGSKCYLNCPTGFIVANPLVQWYTCDDGAWSQGNEPQFCEKLVLLIKDYNKNTAYSHFVNQKVLKEPKKSFEGCSFGCKNLLHFT